MNESKLIIFVVAVFLIFAPIVRAQTGNDFTIRQAVIAGGGQQSAGGTFSLDGTIGQSIAETNPSGNGIFSLQSGFWIPQFAPTAAGVSLNGRVKVAGASGKGIRNAQLTLTNMTTGEVLTTQSGFFGAYRFDDVRAGQTYILAVSARRFSFVENTRVIAVFEELTDIDFTGAEQF